MSESKGYPRTALLALAAVLVVAAVLIVIDLSGVLGGMRERVETTTTTTTLSVERSTTIKETLLQTIERTLVSTVRTTETIVTTVTESVTLTASTTSKAENWIFVIVNPPFPAAGASGIWKMNDELAGLRLVMFGNYTTWNRNMSVTSIRIVGLGINKTLDVKSLLPSGGSLPPSGEGIDLNITLSGARVMVGQVYQVIVEYSREDGSIHRALTGTTKELLEECWLVCRDRPPWMP